jgi:hypothetical protein
MKDLLWKSLESVGRLFLALSTISQEAWDYGIN